MKIGQHEIGPGHPCYVIGEIGINHNGSVEIAKNLATHAALAGCQAVKFQKRTVEAVYTEEELAAPRVSPFGETNGDLKRHLEFGFDEYTEIDKHCKSIGIDWFASPWDLASVDFLEQFNPVAYKIASCHVTDKVLLTRVEQAGRPVILSTGMSTTEEISAADDVFRDHGIDYAFLHCHSAYPSSDGELNLRTIGTLRDWLGIPIGYSGHERGLATTIAAVALGACIVERHITINRTLYGSDQAASIEPHALCKLVRDIRAVESAMGDGIKRVYDSELPARQKLRKVGV